MSASPTENERITVVTGFARSGCTAVMRMLEAGGVPIFPCSPISYQPDTELQAHGNDLFWIARAAGQAVKILEPQRQRFPIGERYDFIYLLRDPHEQAKSQVKFIEFVGAGDHLTPSSPEELRPSGSSEAKESTPAPATGHGVRMRMGTIPHLADNIQRVRRKVGDQLASFSGARLLALRFEVVMRNPMMAAKEIGEFLRRPEFDVERAASVIKERTPWCHPDMLELEFLAEAGLLVAPLPNAESSNPTKEG